MEDVYRTRVNIVKAVNKLREGVSLGYRLFTFHRVWRWLGPVYSGCQFLTLFII